MYAATFDTLPPVGCTVLGAPWSRDRRGNVGADGRRDRFYPRFPRRARLRPPSNASNPAGTARAPFFTGARRYPPSHAGRAWKPAPTRRGEVLGAFRRWLQPLSHGAKRRDSSPFRGAEGVGAVRRRRPLSHAGRAWKPSPTMCRRAWRGAPTSSDRASKRAKRTGPRTGPFCT